MLFRVLVKMWESSKVDHDEDDRDKDEQLKITVTKTIIKTSKQFIWTALFKS